ncbi:MAG: hypothetical protein LBP56_00200 [Odoribacteraceae bacterium]|jgi:hypothetical protein|nr:hypothetical protein [Odoribacteraceae bacterium]
MKNETEVFNLFLDEESIYLYQHEPIRQGNFVYACNNHVMARVFANITEGEYWKVQYPDLSIAFIDTVNKRVLTRKFIKDSMSKAPLVDETMETDELLPCEVCKGRGQVTWTFEDYEKKDDCPACNGSGYSIEHKRVPTGNKIPDPEFKIKIENKTFRLELVKVLFTAMELAGVNKVTMHYNNSTCNEQSIFNLTPYIDVVIMPIKDEN